MNETLSGDMKRQSVTTGRFVSRARADRCNAVTALQTVRCETPADETLDVVQHEIAVQNLRRLQRATLVLCPWWRGFVIGCSRYLETHGQLSPKQAGVLIRRFA